MDSTELDKLIKNNNIYLFGLLQNIQGVEYYFHEKHNNDLFVVRVYSDKVRDNEWKYLLKKEYIDINDNIGFCHYKKKCFFDIYLNF